MAPDLGLELKLSTTKIISNLSKDPSSSMNNDPQAKISRLEHHINSLEEERRKIEVFKRELPLCMHLLDDVIGAMKEEVEQCRREPIQEFMPMAVPMSGGGRLEKAVPMSGGGRLEKEAIEVKLEKDCKDNKMNWMSSAQLWSNNYSTTKESAGESDHRSESAETKNKTLGGAFVPFKGSRDEDKFTSRLLPDLSLVPVAVGSEDRQSSGSKPIASCHVSLQSCSSSQAQRKARRCWSPELHRRFVAALHQLGGAQVATPKQIRELMKVDGLTNDEVKSHLQKYRLHTRRTPTAGGAGSCPVTTTGGVRPLPVSNSQAGSPQGPLQLAGSSRAVSVTAGDSCEDNSKSESYSWK